MIGDLLITSIQASVQYATLRSSQLHPLRTKEDHMV